ncbi:hypothetical protein [Pseudomonas halotolerans]|uniref:hypothetical protein n=1 Tax=Pseudomonas halotolerans TaxID=3143552 RepID=UPI0031CE75E5
MLADFKKGNHHVAQTDFSHHPHPVPAAGRMHESSRRATTAGDCRIPALSDPELSFTPLDPRIRLFEGRQFPGQHQTRFGVFADSSPDRWGQRLMKRRLERDIRGELLPKGSKLYESDYLLGVHDLYRVGALRYKLNVKGNFLDDRDGVAAPPFVELRALEQASQALENDPDNTSLNGRGWRLSAAYDTNPVPHADGLKLNITDADNALDLELALEVAEYFRIGRADAQDIITRFQEVVSQWPVLAGALGLSRREQDNMAPAFHLSHK